MQPVVLSPSADVFVVRPLRKNCVLSQRPHDKDICRGGEYHRLRVQFRPPDDGPVRSETCRGKRITDSVRRREKQCIKLEIKKNKLTEMHGQQNIKILNSV